VQCLTVSKEEKENREEFFATPVQKVWSLRGKNKHVILLRFLKLKAILYLWQIMTV
jgi:hypothetical protein